MFEQLLLLATNYSDGKIWRHINLLDGTVQVCVTLWNNDVTKFGDEDGFPVLIRINKVQVHEGVKTFNTYS